VLKKGKHPR